MCAKKVILGLPVGALKRIDFVDRDLTQALNGLLPAVQEVTIYFIILCTRPDLLLRPTWSTYLMVSHSSL